MALAAGDEQQVEKKLLGCRPIRAEAVCLPMRDVWRRTDGASGPRAGAESPTSSPSALATETQGSSTAQSAHFFHRHHFHPKCGGHLVRELMERWHIQPRSRSFVNSEDRHFHEEKKKRYIFRSILGEQFRNKSLSLRNANHLDCSNIVRALMILKHCLFAVCKATVA